MPEAVKRIASFPLFVVDSQAIDAQTEEIELLDDIVENCRLTGVFQPIIDFRTHSYIGYEGLIRGPVDTPLHAPLQLFAAAERHGLRRKLEQACRETVFRAFAKLQLPGKLFVNSSLDCLDDELIFNGGTVDLLHQIGISPGRVVIELTENQRINDYPDIHLALAHYRSLGYQIAIDDLGEGFANLRMWSEIAPDFVKIDRHFIDGIAQDKLKHHFVKAMQNLAESCSATVVAEGIENEADCLAVRDLGIALGQGFLIAMPDAEPRTLPSAKIVETIKRRSLAVFPTAPVHSGNVTVRSLIRPVEPVAPNTFNDEVYRRFEADPELMSMPVVAKGAPLGLINRHELVDRMARPYRRELFGRKSCMQFMDPMPLCIDQESTVQEAGLIVARSARRHIYDGFIVTRDGEYVGIGSAHDLMGMITEMQIQAARYANPLTQLPGNVPINEHIERLLENRVCFHACYFDLDHFKPFNDVFGYRKGDDIIVLLAQTLAEVIDPLADFCGHIGGDDFMVLFQSDDWESRCRKALQIFDQRIAESVDGGLLDERGGYSAENRRGQMVFYALPALSIGAVPVGIDVFESHREISAAAAEAKKNAKRLAGSSLFVERRLSPAGIAAIA
ncbi:MAG: diguanylate cyclase protein [Proteobacteria bacterium]|nr:diguanylate cyclase protein [Pseudomonadota bacterium]